MSSETHQKLTKKREGLWLFWIEKLVYWYSNGVCYIFLDEKNWKIVWFPGQQMHNVLFLYYFNSLIIYI